jgi:NitT/TauT family transport system ATP-binding protein
MKDYAVWIEGAYQKYFNRKGKPFTVLNDINLKVRPGEFVTIVGPTGCGKSTLLRLILGSEKPVAGRVFVNSQAVVEPDRDRGVVFQRYTLFKNRTVRENVVFGLMVEEFHLLEPYFRPIRCKTKMKTFQKKADEYLKRVGLFEHADKYPYQLSGGQRQRAAIAQTLVMEPEILLMDEPFGALDIGTREEMQVFVLEQWEKSNKTIFFVTHDLEEAIYLGTRVLVLSQFYQDADGAKIVKDVNIPGVHPRPTNFKHTKEFNVLMENIRREGLDPEFLQRIKEFDLSHQDAASKRAQEDSWERRKE